MSVYRIIKYDREQHYHWAVQKRRFFFWWEIVAKTINRTQAERIINRLRIEG